MPTEVPDLQFVRLQLRWIILRELRLFRLLVVAQKQNASPQRQKQPVYIAAQTPKTQEIKKVGEGVRGSACGSRPNRMTPKSL
jgi:hypothetical protein